MLLSDLEVEDKFDYKKLLYPNKKVVTD